MPAPLASPAARCQWAAMVTIRDVAKRAQVSTATVSATLNRSAPVSPELQARVRLAVEELGYAPDGVARSLKTGTTALLGLLIPDITNPFFTELVRVVEAGAQAAGYALLLCDSNEDAAKELTYLRLMRTHRVAGLIWCPVGAAAGDGGFGRALGSLPLVMVDRAAPGIAADLVVIDNHRAGYLATDHLLALGHRRLATIAGPPHLLPAAERLRGFTDALGAHGVDPAAAPVGAGAFREAEAYASCRSLLERRPRPTGLFVANNHMLIGVMRAIADLGLVCPTDISVAAVDDFPWASAFNPRLTTVRQPVAAIGETALRLLLARIAGKVQPPATRTLDCELIVRNSCAPVRGS